MGGRWVFRMRRSRFIIAVLSIFAVGVVIGCWRSGTLNAKTHTCAVCEKPLSINLAHGHRDCYQRQRPYGPKMGKAWAGQRKAVEEAGRRSIEVPPPAPE